MMMPDEVPWAEVRLETLRELTVLDEVPRWNDDETPGPGPAYWEFAIAELERREPESAYAIARSWLTEGVGDGWTRATAWRIVYERDAEYAFAFVEEKRDSVNLAVLARALEAHELQVRALNRHEPADARVVINRRQWLLDIATRCCRTLRTENSFYAEFIEAFSSVERYLLERRIAER